MKMIWRGAILVLATVAGACHQAPDVEQMPLGSEVQLTRQDGGLVEGKLEARDEREVRVEVGPVTRSVPRAEIADVRVVDASAKSAGPPPGARFREYMIPAGSKLTLDLRTAVNTATSRAEDPVEAVLDTPVSLMGVEVLPAGAQVRGIVTSVKAAGKVKGRASIAMQLRWRHGDYPHALADPAPAMLRLMRRFGRPRPEPSSRWPGGKKGAVMRRWAAVLILQRAPAGRRSFFPWHKRVVTPDPRLGRAARSGQSARRPVDAVEEHINASTAVG